MKNQQIIDQRWKKTERAFRASLKEVRDVYSKLSDDAADLIRSLNIRYEDLNKSVSPAVKRKLLRKISEWRDNGIIKGYFAYLVNSVHRYTYANVMKILIYGLYMSAGKDLNTISNRIFKETARDCFDQGLDDLGRKEDPLKWAVILPLLVIPEVNVTFEQYLTVLCETAADEMMRQAIESLRMGIEDLEKKLEDLARKQSNRILNVNDDKETGAIVDMARNLGNEAYILAGGDNDQLVLFVAEIDEKTTRMCRSLDGQIFHTKDWNRFRRYSKYYDGMHDFTVFGLERGLNMPPINDHFHWCRSTLTYQTDFLHLSRDENRPYANSKVRFLGTIDMDRLDEAISYYCEKARNKNVEFSYTIQKDGKMWEVEGKEDSVNVVGDLDGAIVIHNHIPYKGELGGSFGKDDMILLGSNINIEKMILVDEKYNYYAKAKKPITGDDYHRAYSDVKIIDDPDYKHCVMKTLQEMGFVEYERKER